MLPSLLEANVAHDDFELARSVKWELMQLRSRSTTPTADDLMLIARKAGLAEFLQYTSRTAADQSRCVVGDLHTGGFDRKKCQGNLGRPARQSRRFIASLGKSD
jgi:hypothetical protein